MTTEPAIVRFAASFGVALCVVFAMLWFSLEVSGFNERQQRRELEVHEVDVLTDAQRLDVRDLLGGRDIGPSPMLAPLAEIPSLDLSRDVRGIVQLEVLVDVAGSVSDVRVIDASPAGLYEQQAIAEIETKRYEPEYVDGRAVATRRLEIVGFQMRSTTD